MAGDIPTIENAVILAASPEAATAPAAAQAAAVEAVGGRILHRFGTRVLIAEDPAQVEDHRLSEAAPGVLAGSPSALPDQTVEELDLTGRLGLEALSLRRSPEYIGRKMQRPLQGEPWDTDRALSPHPPG